MVRRLSLVVRSSKGTLPLIVAASVVAVECGGDTESSGGVSSGGAGARDASASGGSAGRGGSVAVDASGGIGGVILPGGSGGVGGSAGSAGSGGLGGSPFCNTSWLQSFTVELPPEGTPALPGQICSAAVEPVVSNRAARVTLALTVARDLSVARGFVEIDPNLIDRVVGTPIIEVVDATYAPFSSLQVSGLTREATGYSFDATFTQPMPDVMPDGYARMTVRVSLELDCAPQPETRVVHAATDIHLCIADNDYAWVSSGDDCVVCRVIAEMAPSPIVPEKAYDELPLAQAMRLRIVELARVSNTLILLAENDGGDGLEYEWHPSVGRLTQLAPDVVAWTLEQGMADPFIQAAVIGSNAASVASYAFNEAS